MSKAIKDDLAEMRCNVAKETLFEAIIATEYGEEFVGRCKELAAKFDTGFYAVATSAIVCRFIEMEKKFANIRDTNE